MSYSRGDYLYGDKNGVIQPLQHGEESSERARSQPVKLQPSWEENNLPEDELNFKNLTMDDASLQLNTPPDRYNLVYLTFLIHGIGVLMPWNMFITADKYFTDHKLSEEYTNEVVPYVTNFIQYLTFAAQVPNVFFNWVNIFIQIGGNLTTRIVWSISIEVVVFIVTVILAMIDTSTWPVPFFWITIICVVFLNMANGIYQNTIFGMAAKLPGKYTGAVVLGSNISGTFTAVVNILTNMLTSNKRMAAIYYFITALFILLICFDTYFALPLNERTVLRWIARSQDNLLQHRYSDLPRSGRPRCTNQEQDQAIVGIVRETAFTNSTKIKETLQLRCSHDTIVRRLHENNLHARTPAKKIVLTPDHAARRLAFCRENINRDWSNVIFTDEKVFSTSQETPVLKIWRPDNTRFMPQNVRPNKASGRRSLGYWGWMHRAGPGEVVRVSPPKFNAQAYLGVLDILLESVRIIYPEEEVPQIIMVQDNSSVHTAHIVRNWFDDHPEIFPLNWPPKSPDLNPIENLWSQMVRTWEDPLNGFRIRNPEQLHANVLTVWGRIRNTDYCQRLVDGMNGRLQECIENNGYYISY